MQIAFGLSSNGDNSGEWAGNGWEISSSVELRRSWPGERGDGGDDDAVVVAAECGARAEFHRIDHSCELVRGVCESQGDWEAE